ncbi:4Fe-4S dicluster domain-containing protein [Halovenus sp. WSH3]|uniref:4Fe-4S dicluster domain-containing protein n=1 Tax=Halovenus carboxidivorans TaxID=2692199 RepID=A0A6B0T557_9EURY|nr:Coenzyme F420 hydrogenase/dehydrogenase, beta subunit C-terminal domain [Halovenus carboxidivorans]MXR50683.1 4Fe-4S dicluster domain-containing protein [Halovenus carboxidivorans]
MSKGENRTDHLPRSPGVGDDPREHKDTNTPPGKIRFRDLDEAVIEADRCIQCGSCAAACPSDSIGIDEIDGKPTLVKMCTGCSRCWDFCPRSGLRYERVIEETEANREGSTSAYAVRADDDSAREAGQDGGAVTALLAGLLEAGEIDGAVVAREREDEPLRGEAMLATSREELLESGGSIFNQTMQLGEIDRVVGESDLDDPDLALVGTPCVIQGAKALESFGRPGEGSEIALTVALFCTRSFEYDRLTSLLVEHGVEPEAVDHLDVADGKLFAYGESETLLETDVEAFDAAGLPGCEECADFTGRAADIAAGNVASPDDATTFVVRGERGADALDAAASELEIEDLGDDTALRKLAGWNRRKAEETLPREFDPEGDLSIGYEQHRERYDDTDRAPQSHNPARAYQYERWC